VGAAIVSGTRRARGSTDTAVDSGAQVAVVPLDGGRDAVIGVEDEVTVAGAGRVADGRRLVGGAEGELVASRPGEPRLDNAPTNVATTSPMTTAKPI